MGMNEETKITDEAIALWKAQADRPEATDSEKVYAYAMLSQLHETRAKEQRKARQ